MKITNVAATPAAPTEVRAARAAKQEANREVDSIVISEDGRLVSDWTKQFGRIFNSGSTDNALEFTTSDYGNLHSSAALQDGMNMYDYAADTYMRVKDQIDAKYGDDDEKHKLFMFALDSAFESSINKQTDLYMLRLNGSKMISDKYDSPTYASNPIITHKDFDAEKFALNLSKVGEEFTKAFTQGAKNGLSAAWENVNKVLGSMQTTSINNMSFNDVKIIMDGLSTHGDDLSGDFKSYWIGKYSSLADNSNLSDYMRSVFRTV